MDLNSPIVSVIIPIYNVEKYLNECIDSVISQTHKNLEIILVDDGSTDSSGLKCDQYAQKYQNIKVIHKENGGASSARNCGLKYARGEYIYFPDSDDYILPEALELLLSTAKESNAEVVFFDAGSFVDGNSSLKVKNSYVRRHTYEKDQGIRVLEELQKNGEYSCSIPLLFLRRDFLMNNKLRFVEGIVYEDMLYAFQVFAFAKSVTQCKKKLYQRRYRVNSVMTSRKSKKYFDSYVTVYNAVKDFSREQGILDMPVAKKYIARLAFNVFNDYFKLNSAEKRLCRDTFMATKADILANSAFGDTALKCKCYSNLHWVIYKLYKKTIGKF